MNKSFLFYFIIIIAFTLIMGSCAKTNQFTEKSFDEVTNSTYKFEYQKNKIKPGIVYHFQISDNAKKYKKHVSLYVADYDKIEAFKIYPGSKSTYLVKSQINWKLFSIQEIQQIEISKDLITKNTIKMNLDDKNNYNSNYIFNNKLEIPNGHFPVTNHGYDFSDLNFIFRHLLDFKSNVEIGIIAPVKNSIAYVGKMKISYLGNEVYNNKECYKYSLSGEALNNTEGILLVNKKYGHFEYMELALNYHAEMDFFRYELLSTDTMTETEWDEYIKSKTKDYFSK